MVLVSQRNDMHGYFHGLPLVFGHFIVGCTRSQAMTRYAAKAGTVHAGRSYLGLPEKGAHQRLLKGWHGPLPGFSDPVADMAIHAIGRAHCRTQEAEGQWLTWHPAAARREPESRRQGGVQPQ